jgi:hypothetical protein
MNQRHCICCCVVLLLVGARGFAQTLNSIRDASTPPASAGPAIHDFQVIEDAHVRRSSPIRSGWPQAGSQGDSMQARPCPISEVPNLAVGDQVSIKADLPPGQSVHYLLVAAFSARRNQPAAGKLVFLLRDLESQGTARGLKITVPRDAQQVLVFLAPETGGDFKTLVGAVRGRPGAFVRASQDLNQATLDRSRLKVYLAAIQRISQTDFDHLKTASPLLARSLSIKFDSDCLQKIPELQAPCLMQGRDSLVLNDGHSTSIVQALTSGPTSDLAFALSSTPQAGFGYYSPYISSAMDIARIMESFHTAQYQYIPALATEQGDQLSLELNTFPRFTIPSRFWWLRCQRSKRPRCRLSIPSIPKRCTARKDGAGSARRGSSAGVFNGLRPRHGSPLEGERTASSSICQ